MKAVDYWRFSGHDVAIPAEAPARLEKIRLLYAPEMEVDVAQARVIATLPHLEYLGFMMPQDGGDAVLREIGRVRSIKALYCQVPSKTEFDAS